jgi:hypothetical protein
MHSLTAHRTGILEKKLLAVPLRDLEAGGAVARVGPLQSTGRLPTMGVSDAEATTAGGNGA